MKWLSYIITFAVATIAAYFQAEHEATLGAKILLFAINWTGVYLFIMASCIPDTDRLTKKLSRLPAWIMLSGALIVRAYTFIYIPMVYAGAGMWHLITVNVILLFCELGIFFYGDPTNEAFKAKIVAKQWEKYATKKDEQIEELNKQIEQKAAVQIPAVKRSPKRKTKRKQSANFEQSQSFIVENHETMSQRQMADALNVSAGTVNRWVKQLNGQLK